jgi:hypothetical protein
MIKRYRGFLSIVKRRVTGEQSGSGHLKPVS